MNNTFLNIKSKLISYLKQTYLKFLISYFATLTAFYFIFSTDFFSTLKTVSGFSLFFYFLFFCYHFIDTRNEEKIEKGSVNIKKGFLNRLFGKGNFDNSAMNKLKAQLKIQKEKKYK